MKSNTNPVAIVTGSSKRVGAYIVRTLHQHGYNVIIHYRKSKQAAKTLANDLNEVRPHSAVHLQADFNIFEYIEKLIQQAMQIWPRLDVLVNNASDFFPTNLSKANLQHWDQLINSNLKAPYFLSAYAAPHLEKQQGAIINITDIHGQRPLKDYSMYSIAKAGLIMLTKSLAKEFAPMIRVNAISPGPTLWPENQSELNEQQKAKILAKTPLQRMVEPQHIADSVLFFTEKRSITGQVLNVDCGRSL